MVKKIILIIIVLILIFIGSVLVSNVSYYNIESNKILIEASINAKTKTITDREEIKQIIKLFNNGIFRTVQATECISDRKVIFNENIELCVCSCDGFGYIYDGKEKKSISISKEALEYINKKIEE